MERAYRDAEQIYRQRADLPDWRFGLALARQNLAGVLFKLPRRAEAEAAVRDALGIIKRLVEEFPEVVKYRERLALCWFSDFCARRIQRELVARLEVAASSEHADCSSLETR